MTELEAAWLAGYIDGDGTIGLHRVSTKARRRMCLTIDSADLELLDKVTELAGGFLTKKKKYAEHHRQTWTWRLYGSKRVAAILHKIYPHLHCKFKKERARMMIQEWISLPNGVYSQAQAEEILAFETRFIALGERRGKHCQAPGAKTLVQRLASHPRPPRHWGKTNKSTSPR